MTFYTFLNIEIFDQKFDWLRKIKAKGHHCVIYGVNLLEFHKEKIQNLGFELSEEHPYKLMAENKEHSVFFTVHGEIPNFVPSENVIVSGVSTYDLERITKPISNINQRVKIAECLEKVIKEHGALLAVDYVLAPQKFWVYVQGVYNQWVDSNYVDKNLFIHDLVVNFCIAFYEYNVEKGPLK